MFGKKRRSYQPSSTPGTPLASPLAWNITSLNGGTLPNEEGVFKVQQTSTFHPLNVMWWISYSGGTAEVLIGTPYRPEALERFGIAQLPHLDWTPVRTREGQTIPVELFLDDTGVYARWTT